MIDKVHVNMFPLFVLILLSMDSAVAQSSTEVSTHQSQAIFTIQANVKWPTSSKTNQNESTAETQSDRVLSESQKTLVEGSRLAMLNTGMSERFFNKHFRLGEVVDKPGYRRVVWKLTINEYEATVNDSIGYYTEGEKRINIHSVQNLLSTTTDIKRTISRARALRIMRACLGKFGEAAVEYRAAGSGKAALFLTASSVPQGGGRSQKEVSERERKQSETESHERAMQDQKGHTDVVDEEEEDDGPPVFIAAVNLETGRCVKGRAQAGPPKVP